MTGAVVVGVAPEGCTTAAVRWAAAEAAARGLPLHLVHALVLPAGGAAGEVFAGLTVARRLRAVAERELADMTRLAHETAPDLAVDSVVYEGSAIGVLRGVARTAELLVLGSDGLGPVADLVLGGIARGVCGHVATPVVIVPDSSDPQVRARAAGRAPVVVGDDGTPGSARALCFAVARARDRGAPLVVVRAGDPETVPHERLVAGADGPALEIVVARERADRALAERAAEAELVVLGIGEHGWWHPRPHIRPRVVVHSTSPVAVVPPVPIDVREPAHGVREESVAGQEP